ncbi:hypothetical protein TSOC_005908 [Tetrabaena socialis]|uniref:Amino acid transporter transmembrane domain-containing protein n=1 Tax=Tetrabaena socialis TaxID=47790 RepID=A0A2J8A4Z9_9CHLO|nr:hypothetical protein TSOC_005908 [Tetrabaena socialis]|eukprot:PNH07612.1 hypothetical protein TSOC_005908 [Tetrabaena socialis]
MSCNYGRSGDEAVVRYLTQLSSFFLAGTFSQLVALAIVVYDLVAHAGPPAGAGGDNALLPSQAGGGAGLYGVGGGAELYGSSMVTNELLSGQWTPAAMAILNMVFAYGGQFAFLELLTSMKSPPRFSRAVALCTGIMTALYGGLGAVGYWSKGSSMRGIVVFNMSPGPAAQVAAGLIFLQAVAQYLVNLNVWTHNLLVLLSRRNQPANQNWAEADAPAASTGDHKSSHWLLATVFVTLYSGIVAVVIPFFCTLVGLVTSVTYLTCAYTLPAWFALTLLRAQLGPVERGFLIALIPITLALSAVGLTASVWTYVADIGGGGEGMRRL